MTKKQFLTVGILIFVFVSVLFAFVFLPEVIVLTRTVPALQAIQKETADLEELLAALDFKTIAERVPALKEKLQKVVGNFERISRLKKIPFLGKNLRAIHQMLEVSLGAVTEAERIAQVFGDLLALLERASAEIAQTKPLLTGEASFEDIPREVKREILRQLFESLPLLQGLKANLALGLLRLEELEKLALFSTLKKARAKLIFKLRQVETGVKELIPFVQILPEIAGYPEQKNYLVFFLNNRELRPAGGFIGTYGVLKVQDSEIDEFATDDIYNLDRPSEKFVDIEPPWQIKKYLSEPNWFLRDSNWSPDFQISSEKAMEFYALEKGVGADIIQGIIGFTPTFVAELLKFTGPIEVEGESFDWTNFHDKLEWKVEKGYVGEKIPETQRKEIIGALGKKLKTTLIRLPLRRYPAIFNEILNALEERQLMLWSRSPVVAELIKTNRWGGDVMAPKGDFLQIIDANLASLKTDEVMERMVDYELKEDQEGLLAKVRITYRNAGRFFWKWTRYRTYTRVFVPNGSTLVSSSGAMENDKILDPQRRPGKVEVGEDLGKTFFGAFISVEPREEKTLEFTYRLPKEIENQVTAGVYNLFVQKQAGTLESPLTLRLQFARMIKEIQPKDFVEKLEGNSAVLKTDLRVDREFLINL